MPNSKPGKAEAHNCPTCNFPPGDPGYLRCDVPHGHKDFGRLVPCPDCHAQKVARRKRNLNQLEGWLKEATFDNYKVNEANRAAYEAAIEFANDPTGFLTLWGEFGPGKTHLLAAIHNRLTDRGATALYTTLPDLVSQHRATIGGKEEPEEFYQYISKFQVLLIDEVDKADLRNWTREQSFRLFNRRYNTFRETGTVMAMNKNPKAYDGEIGYLFSRMRDERAACVYVGGGDNRTQAGILQKLGKKLIGEK